MDWPIVATALAILVLVALFTLGWDELCICVFKGGRGKLWIDPNCAGCLSLWVIPEDLTSPAFTPARSDTWYPADGFVIAGQVYKVDGSTCAYIRCDERCQPRFSACLNLLALVGTTLGALVSPRIRRIRPPYVVPAGQFANEPPPGAPAQPVQ